MPGYIGRALLFLGVLCAFGSNSSAQLRKVYLDSDSSNVINRISFFSANEGYVAFTKWIGHTTDTGHTFTPVYITIGNVNLNGYSVNLTFGFVIEGVKALDQNKLIAYGNYGFIPAILYSSNGGAAWTLVFQSQYSYQEFNSGIMDVDFPADATTGFAVDEDRILKTTDGGQTWNTIYTAAGSYFNHLESVDNNTVFAMNTTQETSTLVRTTNGGASWSAVPMPPIKDLNLYYAYFLTAATGWMSAIDDEDNLYFFKTTNGGTSWTQLNNSTATPFTCTKMRFLDTSVGFAITPGFQVFKTQNSGVLWEPLPRDNTYSYLNWSFNDLQCWSPSQLWAGGGHGFLELSTNGGGTPIPKAHFLIDTTGENMTGIVKLVNYSNPAYQSHWYVNGTLVSTGYDTTYTHTLSRSSDTVTLIVTGNGLSDTLTLQQFFTIPNLPKIVSFGPQGGGSGTLVAINGSGFSGVNSVSFGGVPATSFTIQSDKLIWATVGNGATGAVGVGDIHGTSFLPGFSWLPAPAAPPSVTSVTPAAGPIGSTVTITGSGFSATPGGTKVLFGSINAPIQSISATTIVCTVPPGAVFDNIYVYNTAGGLSCQSRGQFNVTFADSANFTGHSFTQVFNNYFSEYTVIPTTAYGRDVDGDGKPDLMVNMFVGGADSMTIYRNISRKGSIIFAPRVNVAYTFDNGEYGFFQAVDLDGDGLVDIVAPDNAGDVILVRNTSKPGAISFAPPVGLVVPNGDLSVAVGDIDGDGRNDIAVAGVQGQLSLLRNTGTVGTLAFSAPQNLSVGAGCVALADLDGDGKKEIITLGPSGSVSVFQNASTPGNISLGQRTDFATSGSTILTMILTVADVDGDGLLDVMARTDQGVFLFRNTSTPGHIAFAQPVTTSATNMGIGNFGGGYLPDLAESGDHDEDVLFSRNVGKPGTIAFDPIVELYNYASSYGTAADFDMDGKPDLAVSNATEDGWTIVYKNNVGVPVPFKVCRQTGYPQLQADVSGTSYQWQRDNGSGFANLSDNDTLTGTQTGALAFVNAPAAWNGNKFRCRVDSLYTSVFVLEVDSSSSPGAALQVSDSTICYGTPVTFAAGDTKGDTTFTYKWLVNGQTSGTTTSHFLSTTLRNNDKVQVIMNYNNACGYYADTTRIITMQVTESPDSVSVSVPATTICAGSSIAFTATPVNPGPTPSYTWTVNGVAQPATGPVFMTSSLATGQANQVQVTLNGSAACAMPQQPVSNVITVNVTPAAPASVSIAANHQEACAGATFVFTATPGSAVVNPVYNWFVNGAGMGDTAATFTTSTLQNNDTIRCEVTGERVCAVANTAVSDSIVVTVDPLETPSISVTTTGTDVCNGAPVTFTAHPVDPGSAPYYQWYRNHLLVLENDTVYTDANPINGDQVFVWLTNNDPCTSKAQVTIYPIKLTVEPTPGVLISATDSVLAPEGEATLTATATDAGVSPAFQWQDSTTKHGWENIPGGQVDSFNYAPSDDGESVRCLVTSPLGCTATSRILTFSVNPYLSNTRYYPNPATSTLYVKNYLLSDGFSSIEITSASGSVCLRLENLGGQDLLTLDVSSLVKGVYFVKVQRQSGAMTHFKFVKM